MFFTMEQQWLLVLQSVLLGFMIGVLYDFLRALRRLFAAGRIMTAVCDAIFWVLVLALVFEFGILFAAGNNRAFVLVGIVMGVFAYFQTLSGAVLLVFNLIGAALGWVFACILQLWEDVKMVYAHVRDFEKNCIFSKKFGKASSIFRGKGLK